MFGKIQFPYNYVATIQATALLLTLYRRHLHWQYVIYLLYLCDRQHLIRYGSPVTGDVYVCWAGKPYLLYTAELLHHRTPSTSSILYSPRQRWQNYFTLPNQQDEIQLVAFPGNTELTSSMEETIHEIFDRCYQFNLSSLEQWCYCLSECEDRGYPRLIEVDKLLAKNGYELEDLIAVKNNADTECYFANIEDN